MNRRPFAALLALALLLLSSSIPMHGSAQSDPEGPQAVVGQFGSANFGVTPELFPEATIALVDASNVIENVSDEWLPIQGQVLGYSTTPLFPTPSEYRIGLPIAPSVSAPDLDNDGEENTGVQVFYLIVASNLIGDSYLQQLEQIGGLASFLTDPISGAFTEGDLLVFADDSAQTFPSGFGDDEIWFTGDDQAEPLDQGYTVVRLASDGTSVRDRSPEVTIDTREEAERASPDFSDQGILESFNSLIDHLSIRYAWTELRGLDWEAIRVEFLPEVESADADQDFVSYFLTLNRLAHSLLDAHVSAVPSYTDPDQLGATANILATEYGYSIGASAAMLTEPDDIAAGTATVIGVGEDSPADAAGWVPGTVIVSIDGQSPAERLETIPLIVSVGTEEAARVQRMGRLLMFPENSQVVIEYRLPNSDAVLSVEMTAGDYSTSSATGTFSFSPLPITISQEGLYTVMTWGDFITAVGTKVAVLEEALALHQGFDSGGMIIDMRGNSGGWAELYETMASYFYTEENPLPAQVFDSWMYDFNERGFVRSATVDYQISAPKPELAYTGPLVVLINETCASACEFFTQTLQTTGRATVIGQYASTGAGGPIDVVSLPGDIRFSYTVGRSTFSGTEDPNIEAKGVIPDVRVPVTLQTEMAKQNAEDPVMAAAVAYLDQVNLEMMEEEAAPAVEASPEATPES